MRPPRRSRKKRTKFTPNSPPEGLNPVNEAPTQCSIQDKRESHANDIYKHVLRPRGWKFSGRGNKENWSFIPASLAEQYKTSEVFNIGVEGVHYACGWGGLAEMLDRFGEDYSPSSLPSAAPPRAHCTEDDSKMKARVQAEPAGGDDDETVSDDSCAEDEEQHQVQQGEGETELIEEENEGSSVVQTKQEDDEEMSSSTAPNENANLSTTLECLKKCREELTWLQRNPNFHGEETEICEGYMKETIVNLYSQISNYNGADNNEDDDK